jgi:hypothetical protein
MSNATADIKASDFVPSVAKQEKVVRSGFLRRYQREACSVDEVRWLHKFL